MANVPVFFSTSPSVPAGHRSAEPLFPAVDVDDLVLVYVFEDVRGVHEDADGADGGDDEEDVQLQPVDHHRHKLPVLAYLEEKLRDC